MRKRRFTEEQIIGVLKSAEAGMAVKEVCRQHGITETTYYRWKKKCSRFVIPRHPAPGA